MCAQQVEGPWTETPTSRIAAGMVALLLLLALWIFGLTDLPSAAEVMAAKTADTIGVWAFTWSLIWVGSVAAVGIVWICWSDVGRDRSEERSHVA